MTRFALLAFALSGCAIDPYPCPELDAERFGKARVIERSCPVEEFEVNERHRCTVEREEFDEHACTFALRGFCTGTTVVEHRYVADDGLVTVRQEHQQIETGCRVVLEIRERA